MFRNVLDKGRLDKRRFAARRLLAIAIGCALALPASAGSDKISGHANINPDGKLEVKNVRGLVKISVWDRNEVDVGGSLGDGSKFLIDGSPAAVSIRIESGDSKSWWGWGASGPREDTTLEIRVPKGIAPDIHVVSADVEIQGLDGSREINVDSVSGDVRVEARTQRLELKSVSGDFNIAGSAARSSFSTVSGDVIAQGVGGEVAVESVSGDARFEGESVREFKGHSVSGDTSLTAALAPHARVKIESMSGDVRLRVPGDISAAIEAKTFSGSIRTDFGKTDKEEYGPGEKFRAKLGGADAEIDIETFSGDVDVDKR